MTAPAVFEIPADWAAWSDEQKEAWSDEVLTALWKAEQDTNPTS